MSDPVNIRTQIITVGAMHERYISALAELHGMQEAKAITRLVFENTFGWDRIQLDANHATLLDDQGKEKLLNTLDRLLKGEPLQYIIGEVHFMGLTIRVAPGVLIPRPETEEMVDRIIRKGKPPTRILDIGTGSGCIALALKHVFPTAAVIGVDVSQAALDIATTNAERLGISVLWQWADVLQNKDVYDQEYDLIISNPPYIPEAEANTLCTHVRAHEPSLALFVTDKDPLLFYRSIAENAFGALVKGGSLWFECHLKYADEVATLLKNFDYVQVELINDLSGNQRFVHATR